MASPLYILCPGQGAQVVGMGRDLYASSAVAKKLFDDARAIVGFDLADVRFNGPEERLNQTDVSQPAIYVTSVASFHASRMSASAGSCSSSGAGPIASLVTSGSAGLG